MIDFIKCTDLHLPMDSLLIHPRLLFPLPIDKQNGAIFGESRRAIDQGLLFTLTPSTRRCEIVGSLHRYHNGGTHNANAYTVADLADTLQELAQTYQINLRESPLNNLKFGVNIALPFPVSQVLSSLISYKNRPFLAKSGEGFAYYQCHTQRYVVKFSDKGAQYRRTIADLPDNLLRMEIKVLRMEYLTRQGIRLRTLADLLNVTVYPQLGQLLLDTFNDILFDEPSLDLDRLNAKQQRLCLAGRDGRTWLLPKETPKEQRAGLAKQIQRREQQFRALLATYRQGEDWVGQTAGLLADQWHRLTEPSSHQPGQTGLSPETCPVLTDSPQKCPVLTDFSEKVSTINRLSAKVSTINQLSDGHPVRETILTSEGRGTPPDLGEKRPESTPSARIAKNPKVSTINRLSIGLLVDTSLLVEEQIEVPRGTPVLTPALAPVVSEAFSGRRESPQSVPIPIPNKTPTTPLERLPRYCAVTGVEITHQPPKTHLATAKTLERLRKHVPAVYAQIVARFLPLPGEPMAEVWRADNVARLIRLTDQTPTALLQRLRACPLTHLDITHQRPTMTLASQLTLQQLAQDDPRTFERVSTAFLSPQEQALFLPTRCHRLAVRLRQLVTEQAHYSDLANPAQ